MYNAKHQRTCYKQMAMYSRAEAAAQCLARHVSDTSGAGALSTSMHCGQITTERLYGVQLSRRGYGDHACAFVGRCVRSSLLVMGSVTNTGWLHGQMC
jgi:hypothetical protein